MDWHHAYIIFFAVLFPIFPVSGAASPLHFVLPAFTLGIALAAEMTRLTRASVLEVIEQEYVQTARAKGQKERIVIGKHVFLNALIPVVTIIGLQFPQLIGGAIVVETVFFLGLVSGVYCLRQWKIAIWLSFKRLFLSSHSLRL